MKLEDIKESALMAVDTVWANKLRSSLTILGVFGGFVAFGFLGLFIGPTLIAIMFTLLQAWRAAISDHPAAEVMKPAA